MSLTPIEYNAGASRKEGASLNALPCEVEDS